MNPNVVIRKIHYRNQLRAQTLSTTKEEMVTLSELVNQAFQLGLSSDEALDKAFEDLGELIALA